MTRSELDERVSVWLGTYDQNQLPPAQSVVAGQIQALVDRGWQASLLRNAADLEVPSALGMPDVAAKLERAIELGKSGNVSNTDEVARLLHDVQAALHPRPGT